MSRLRRSLEDWDVVAALAEMDKPEHRSLNPKSIGVNYFLIVLGGGGVNRTMSCFDHLIGKKLFLYFELKL